MTTRLGLHSDDAFAHYLMVSNGFIQGLNEDNGYMVPHHEYTMSMPASLTMEMKYNIYIMYTCFVRTPLAINSHYYLSVLDDEMFFTLRVMEYFDNQEAARCRHKQLNNDEYDLYDLEDFKVTEITEFAITNENI